MCLWAAAVSHRSVPCVSHYTYCSYHSRRSPGSFMAGNHLWWLVKTAEPFAGWAYSASLRLSRNRQTTSDPAMEGLFSHEMDADDFTGLAIMSDLSSDSLYKLFYTTISNCLLWQPSHVENEIKCECKKKKENKIKCCMILSQPNFRPDAVSGTFVCLGCRN